MLNSSPSWQGTSRLFTCVAASQEGVLVYTSMLVQQKWGISSITGMRATVCNEEPLDVVVCKSEHEHRRLSPKQNVVVLSLTTYMTDLKTCLILLNFKSFKAVSWSMWVRMKGRTISLVRYGSRHELKGCVTGQSTFLEDHKLCVASHQLCRSRTSQDTLVDLDLHRMHSPAVQNICQAQRSACHTLLHMPWSKFCPKG